MQECSERAFEALKSEYGSRIHHVTSIETSYQTPFGAVWGCAMHPQGHQVRYFVNAQLVPANVQNVLLS